MIEKRKLLGDLLPDKDYTLKLVIIGDPAVGKSSLIVRYVKDKFDSDYISTLGVDFLVKKINLIGAENAKATLILWDIGGQAEWKSKLHIYLDGADGAVVVCDLTRPTTGKNISSWVKELKEYAGDIPYILVANKNDLEQKIPDSDLKIFSEDHPYFKSSAKTGDVVEELFHEIAVLMIKDKKEKVKLKM